MAKLRNWLRIASRRVVFRSAKDRPFAERKATLISGQHRRGTPHQEIGGQSPLLQEADVRLESLTYNMSRHKTLGGSRRAQSRSSEKCGTEPTWP